MRAKESTFDTFIDDCMQLFWALLRPKLSTIQAKIRLETKPVLVESCNSLLRDVEQLLLPSQAVGLLENINAAKTEIQLVLDRVSDWFQLGEKSPGTGTFTIDQILDIAEEVIRRTRRGFQPKVTRSVTAPSLVVNEFSLATLNDCIFIMLDNVYRHSMAGPSPEVKLAITYGRERAVLIIRCTNTCGVGARTADGDARLLRTRETIDRGGNYDDVVRNESGSGLFRLWRMTERLGPKAIGFGFSSDASFWVEAHLPVFLEASAI
jgi:hypothetical protein